ncbi:MAG TPA: aspartate dehydrogenase [Afipia sp.]
MKIAVIGYGAIGNFLVSQLVQEPTIDICAILSQPAPASCPYFLAASIGELLQSKPDLVVECAGHHALHEFGQAVLLSGTDLLVVSVGALAEAALEDSLRSAAAKGGGRLLIAGGALGGIDTISTAREAGLSSVEYVGRKAPAAWKGTAAETLIKLDQITEAFTFIQSDARTIALKFPQNANVVAALALAGLGFEKTEVKLVVDPAALGNSHSYVARGSFGEITATIMSRTLESNPKTSMLAPYSLVQVIKKRAGLILA